MMAYSLAEKELPGRTLFLNMVIFTMLFSGGMIPTFFVVRQTGLVNSLWSLIIPGLVSPFNLIVMKNFYQGIPYELKESARIDGCHEVVIMLRIIMPLSLPSLATFGLFYAVGIWNTYMSALLYIQKDDLWPIQVLLRRIVYVSTGLGDSESVESSLVSLSQSIKMAVILVATAPILCVYPFLQKHFAKGMMVGSVKG
jgi:putative aldouronate transport system permease protein